MAQAEDAQLTTLVVGASGQVGGRTLRALRRPGRAAHALPTSREPREGYLQLDLAALDRLDQAEDLLDRYHLESIRCIGGMTNVEACESHREAAFRTNATGPAILAKYASRRHLPFVYFSTEYVFDGLETNPGPYTEQDPTRPLSVYGESKLAGERDVLDAHPGALIARTTVVYGPDTRAMNFLYSVVRNLTTGTPMSVPEDQISTPTYNDDLVHAVEDLIRSGVSGIFHVVGPECMDRYAFSREIAQHFSLDESLLQPVPTTSLHQKARRPLFAGLSIQKLQTTLPHLTMHTVAETLTRCAPELAIAFPSLGEAGVQEASR